MRAALLSAMLLLTAGVAHAEITSVYTDLDGKTNCITVDQAEDGDGDWATLTCSGYMGFPIILDYGDARETAFYGYPRGGDRPWESFEGFNGVGKKVEWRLQKDGDKTVPFATIVRWSVSDSEDPDKQIEVLVVSKVGQPKEQEACVVGLVLATGKPDANEMARKIADEQATVFSCGDERTVVGEPMPAFGRQEKQ